jgi:prolyl 4-hydroxylase
MELKLIFLIVDILLFITWVYYFFVWEKKKLTIGVSIGIAVNWIVLICMYIFVHEPTDDKGGTDKGGTDKGKSYHDTKKQLVEHKHLAKIATKVLGDDGTPVYILDNFMTRDECDKIIKGAQGNMTASNLTRASDDPDFRTSETCYFTGTPIQKHVDKKICDAIGINTNMSEPCQIQHYNLGNQFKAHHDFFHGGDEFEEFAGDNSNYQGQRTWTFMVFLNNVKKGGETEFINLNNLHVTPKTGTAVVWNSLNGDGTTNDRTLHQGKPILGGEKYIITKWFRERVQK